jgi:hypothetical protein
MQRMPWLLGIAAVAGVSIGVAPTDRPSPTQAPEVTGSWTLVSAKANGRTLDFPAGTTILKHVTPTDFIFIHHDRRGQITAAGGGRYTVNGSRYEETVEYGLGEGIRPLFGKTQVFTLRIDGRRWHQHGKETDGTVIEEVWERVQPVRSP